jgi:hypothetical protein
MRNSVYLRYIKNHARLISIVVTLSARDICLCLDLHILGNVIEGMQGQN